MPIKYCPQCQATLVAQERGEKLRLSCPVVNCGYVFWNNPIPVVAAIVEMDGSIVLARNKTWPTGMFGLITGFLEQEETPEEAVLREVDEELALTGEIKQFVGNYVFYQMNQLIIAYHILAKGDISLGDELAEIKIVPIKKLKPWPFGTGHAVKDWLEQYKK